MQVGTAAAERISQLEIEIPDIVKKGADLTVQGKQNGTVMYNQNDQNDQNAPWCPMELEINGNHGIIGRCRGRIRPPDAPEAAAFGAAQPRLVRQEPSEAMKLPMLPAAAIRVSWVD